MKICFLLSVILFNFPNALQAATPDTRTAAEYVLRDEINIERQHLQSIDDELGQLRRQQRTLEKEISVDIADRVRGNNAEIQNLSDLLQTQRSREAAIDRTTDSYLNQIIAASRANSEQMMSNIQSTEQKLKRLQDEISFSTMYPVSATMTGNPERQSLQSEINAQNVQLDNLKQQRERSGALQLEQIQILNGDSAYQKNQLYEDLSSLQDSISALRSENARLEAEKVQSQLNLRSVQQQLSEQQKLFQQQQAKVQRLDSGLQKQSTQ